MILSNSLNRRVYMISFIFLLLPAASLSIEITKIYSKLSELKFGKPDKQVQ